MPPPLEATRWCARWPQPHLPTYSSSRLTLTPAGGGCPHTRMQGLGLALVYAGVRGLWPVWIPTLLQAAVSLSLAVAAASKHEARGVVWDVPDDVRWCSDGQWTMDNGAPVTDGEHDPKVRLRVRRRPDGSLPCIRNAIEPRAASDGPLLHDHNAQPIAPVRGGSGSADLRLRRTAQASYVGITSLLHGHSRQTGAKRIQVYIYHGGALALRMD